MAFWFDVEVAERKGLLHLGSPQKRLQMKQQLLRKSYPNEWGSLNRSRVERDRSYLDHPVWVDFEDPGQCTVVQPGRPDGPAR